MVQITGKYSFASQENFDEYLKAADVGMMLRTIVAATKPDLIIEADGDVYTITTVTALKTIKVTFTLGQEYEADPGTEKKTKYLTTLEGDTLVTKDLNEPSAIVTRKFTDDGLCMIGHSGSQRGQPHSDTSPYEKMTVKEVTATRHFKRV